MHDKEKWQSDQAVMPKTDRVLRAAVHDVTISLAPSMIEEMMKQVMRTMGARGGKARAASLSPAKRKAIARKAAAASAKARSAKAAAKRKAGEGGK